MEMAAGWMFRLVAVPSVGFLKRCIRDPGNPVGCRGSNGSKNGQVEITWVWFWFDFKVVESDRRRLGALDSAGKTKNPPAFEAGGVPEKIDDRIRS